ncbi:MAG: FIST N-terminal domain-containing protein [Archangium sp.]|nr:FIST N-terminal domain-containing protein [Archangium sp.]MDP3571580.1 FIST N-terminal domain-containing protein [Archangium sp.]
MTESFKALTREADSSRAAAELATAIRAGFHDAVPDALIVFASARHDYETLLGTLAAACGTNVIIGSSSAGEFTHRASGEGYVSALALRSHTMRFGVGVGQNLSQAPLLAAREVVNTFQGLKGEGLPHRSALVMTDALAGHTEAVIEELTLATGGNYNFFGGGAGDDGRFQETHVFAGTRSLRNAVVALEMLSAQPLGIGVSHGWEPTGEGFRVTEAEGARLVSLNAVPAVQAFEAHAATTGQKFDRRDPLPFFLHNILGIKSSDGYRLRVPLTANEDGSISCAAAIPAGAIVRIMKTSDASAILAAEQATRSALEALGGRRAGAALVFDCVATRLRLGKAFDAELKACALLLEPAGFVGCNTYGQIARAEGQFGGFHNCTAVVCAIPE